MKVSKHQWGGPSQYLTLLAEKSTQEVLDDAKKTEPIQYAIPIYGTYLALRDAVKEPSGTNIGLAALSTVGDIGTAVGLGELANIYVAGVKNAPKLAKASAAVDEGMKAYRTAEQAAINAAAKARKANLTAQAATMSGANLQVLLKYTKLANEAQANANQAYKTAGALASKLNGLIPKSNVTNISRTTSGTTPGVFKETSVLPNNKDLFYIGPNYGGNTGLLGELNAAELAMPLEITKIDKISPGLMYFTGHTPAYLNAEGAKYVSEKKQGGNMNYISYLKEGSGIHIKPSHKGRFTEYCDGKVTQDCINRGKRSPDPKIRKQAVFAENARKWKHQNGGEMLFLLDWFDNILKKQNVFFNAKENKFEEIVPEVKEAERKSFTPLISLDAADPEKKYDNSWMTELLLILSRSSQEGSTTRQVTTPSTSGSTTRQATTSSTGRSSIGQFTDAWQKFRDTLYNILRNRGYSEDTSKVMVALMGQESGHGQHLTGDYNYSNITRGSNWTGRTTKVGSNPNIFRSYDNLEQAIDDYLALNKAYGINENTSKDEVLQRWLGHNDKKLAWNGKDNTAYKKKIDAVYKMYWE